MSRRREHGGDRGRAQPLRRAPRRAEADVGRRRGGGALGPRAGRRSALSLGALGVVYGDIGTSPLYTVQLIFSGDHPMAPSPLRVYGALSLIFWALLLVVTLKYVLLILRVDNHGEGGIMALVALIERVVEDAPEDRARDRRRARRVALLRRRHADAGDLGRVGRLGAQGGVARPGGADRAVLAGDPDRACSRSSGSAPARWAGCSGRSWWSGSWCSAPWALKEVAAHPGHPPGALADLRRRSSSPTTRRWGSSRSDPSSSR